MTDKHRKYLYNENNHRQELARNFNFWLTIAVTAIFILLLFYSQKIQGTM